MNKIRICFVIPSHWSANMGGAEYQVSLIINSLIQDDRFEIFYICRNTTLKGKQQGYIIYSVKNHSRFSKYAYFTDAPNLYKQLKLIDPDVIYHRNGGAYTGVCAFYSKKYEKKFIWNLAHNDEVTPSSYLIKKTPLKLIDKLLLRYGLHIADTIVAQTHDQQQLLNKHYKKSTPYLIKNFHPTPKIKPSVPSNCINILWVANFKNCKQPELFFRLAQEYESNNSVKFFMAGRADRKYRPLLDLISSTSNITYLGVLNQDDVNQAIFNADIFINTSIAEGFPNTFIQAWMREVPVISLNVNPDNILTSENIGCYSRTMSQLNIDLNNLIAHPKLRIDMGKRARNYAIKNHSQNNIKKLIKLFL